MIVAGVDPLGHGAICLVGEAPSGTPVFVSWSPLTSMGIRGDHRVWAPAYAPRGAEAVYLENCMVMGNQTSRVAAQTIGISWAWLFRDLLAEYPGAFVEVVSVRDWQKAILLPGKGDSKVRARKTFRALFLQDPPSTGNKERDKGVIDAALIGVYGLRKEREKRS